MATKKSSSTTKVTRLKAADTENDTLIQAEQTKKAVVKAPLNDSRSKNPLRAIGGYFAGAWYELKQVHWPNRRATWSLTGAMLVFTGIFVVIILLLDALFKYLFGKILG